MELNVVEGRWATNIPLLTELKKRSFRPSCLGDLVVNPPQYVKEPAFAKGYGGQARPGKCHGAASHFHCLLFDF